MDESDDGAKRAGRDASPSSGSSAVAVYGEEQDTLPAVIRGFFDGVRAPPDGSGEPLLRRLREASHVSAERLRGASRNSARDLLAWTRRGGAPRALLVISVGSITLIALTGLLIFMFFLVMATVNAIIVSVLMSLAAAGGFLAMFLAFLAAIYICALSVAVFVISAMTIATIVAISISTGWVGFLWIVWFTARKSLDLTKRSIGMTTSTI